MTQVLTIGEHHAGGETRFSVSIEGALAASHLLVGRRCADAIRLMPLIFNLCPAAQGAAAAMAMDLSPAADTHTAIASETLREHALVMLRDWPLALQETPRTSDLAGLAMLSGARIRDLEHALFASRAVEVLDNFDGWLQTGESAPARYLARAAQWEKSAGRIDAEPDPTFISRIVHHPAMRAIIKREGITLFARMAARLIEAALLIEEIASGSPGARYGRSDDGRGWAEAARGRLLHHVRLRNGLIEDYRIATPTDSMVGNGAFLQRLLQSAATGSPAERGDRIRIALTCADPCLPVIWRARTKCDA